MSEPTLRISPVKRDECFAFIRENHRHLKRDKPGWLFGVCLRDETGAIVGTAYLSRPASRHLDDGLTAEVSRCCTLGQRNACSQLYGALRKAAAALGYTRVVTYTTEGETGASIKAAGFVADRVSRAEEWTRPARARATAEDASAKTRWVWLAGSRVS